MLIYRNAVNIHLRTKLSEAQNHRCAWCGCQTTELRNLRHSATIEHVQPRSLGGADDYSNMVMACNLCNSQRGVLSVDKFLTFVQAGKPYKPVNESRRQQIEFVRSHGFRVGGKTKPTRIKRMVEKIAVLEAMKTNTGNPYKPDSRMWRTFNRYSQSQSLGA